MRDFFQRIWDFLRRAYQWTRAFLEKILPRRRILERARAERERGEQGRKANGAHRDQWSFNTR